MSGIDSPEDIIRAQTLLAEHGETITAFQEFLG
jgi:hypothetical protein